MSNQYAQRDHRALGEHYLRHVSAMTGEGLHAKSDIAAELAWRDARIDRLEQALLDIAEIAEHIENGPITDDESQLYASQIVDIARGQFAPATEPKL